MSDKELGLQVCGHLRKLGIETPMTNGVRPKRRHAGIISSMTSIMQMLQLDLSDDSLKGTPARVAKMFLDEIFYGLNYDNFPKMTVIENKMKCNEMVAVSCTVKSLCEHHFVPFIGIAHIAYIPKTKILGLSKFNRVTDFFSRRPQVQERLTSQIHAALTYVLETADVAVVIKATHYCVHLRGVQDEHSQTTTSQMAGRFMSKPALRQEFLELTR